MSVDVLRSRSQVSDARETLRKRRLSCTDSKLMRIARKLGLIRTLKVGDESKSWDVLRAARFIEKTVPAEAAILDIGAYASEILCILHRLGYTNLTGVDLNPGIDRMPYADKIRYAISDFMRTPFGNEAFDVITSTSVIEHGFNGPVLLAEMSRLLRIGGYFIASFDYWPEKLDTTGVPFFGMDWRIFSREEVLSFIDEARAYNLVPCGSIDLSVQEKPIKCAGKEYTFAWLALRKAADHGR